MFSGGVTKINHFAMKIGQIIYLNYHVITFSDLRGGKLLSSLKGIFNALNYNSFPYTRQGVVRRNSPSDLIGMVPL